MTTIQYLGLGAAIIAAPHIKRETALVIIAAGLVLQIILTFAS